MADETPTKHAYHIESLARGLAVLDAFSPLKPELTLKDVAAAANVTQPSALRIAFTLVEAGYLRRNPTTKGYRLGPKTLSVGLATMSSLTIPEVADPYLVELRDRTEETVKLAMPAEHFVVVVARIPSKIYPPSLPYVGSRTSMHLGSLGRAILAWRTPAEVERLLTEARDTDRTPHTIKLDDVRKELDATRRRGYAINDRGTTSENRSIAAPIIEAGSGLAVASLNVSVAAHRVSLKELEAKYAPDVVQAAESISGVLPPHNPSLIGSGAFD